VAALGLELAPLVAAPGLELAPQVAAPGLELAPLVVAPGLELAPVVAAPLEQSRQETAPGLVHAPSQTAGPGQQQISGRSAAGGDEHDGFVPHEHACEGVGAPHEHCEERCGYLRFAKLQVPARSPTRVTREEHTPKCCELGLVVYGAASIWDWGESAAP
jgi:hypothetical protein